MAQKRDETLKDPKVSNDRSGMEGKGLESKKTILDEGNLDDEDMNSLEKNLTLKAELVKAKAVADENYSQLQRLQADFDNYKKGIISKKKYCVRVWLKFLIS